MANPDRTRKLLMRSALATSATIATFVGAQNLAMLDASQFSQETTVASNAAAVVLPQDAQIAQTAPGIVVLRNSSDVGTSYGNLQGSTLSATSNNIQAPVIVQRPIRRIGRSSR